MGGDGGSFGCADFSSVSLPDCVQSSPSLQIPLRILTKSQSPQDFVVVVVLLLLLLLLPPPLLEE